jgi:hypothetical protein
MKEVRIGGIIHGPVKGPIIGGANISTTVVVNQQVPMQQYPPQGYAPVPQGPPPSGYPQHPPAY